MARVRTETQTKGQVVVRLDSRIALEAILLNRLERLPPNRRQEWLRHLLVQGFRAECQLLRAVTEESRPSAATAFTRWLTESAPRPPTPEAPIVTPTSHAAANTTKPFAALRKVIG